MALDRFVRWRLGKPTDVELRMIIEDYVRGVGTLEDKPQKNGRPWFFITLPGKPSHPLTRISDVSKRPPPPDKERWFEVFVDDDSVDVMTRQSDEFTGVVADGLGTLLARFYKAEIER